VDDDNYIVNQELERAYQEAMPAVPYKYRQVSAKVIDKRRKAAKMARKQRRKGRK